MTTSGGKPAARASRPGRAVEPGRDGPWRVAGRPRLQLLAAEETGGDMGPPAEAARAKLETRARAARRRRKLERETATSLRWALFLWASTGFAWVSLMTMAYKVARAHLPFALTLAAAMSLLLGAPVIHPRLRLRAPGHDVPGHQPARAPRLPGPGDRLPGPSHTDSPRPSG